MIVREKRRIRLETQKQNSSRKSGVWKNFSLIFEKRHDVDDAASCDFYVLWIGLRVESGRVGSNQELRKLAGRAGLRFSGRVGWQNLDQRATLVPLIKIDLFVF